MQIRGFVFIFLYIATQVVVFEAFHLSFYIVPWVLWHITFSIFLFKLFTAPADEKRWLIGPTIRSVAFTLTALNQHDTHLVWYICGSGISVCGFVLIGLSSKYLGDQWRDTPLTTDHETNILDEKSREMRIVTNGTYSFVRHPLYAGLLTEALGSVVTGGFSSFVAIIAFVSSFTGYFIQLWQEEKELVSIFGDEYVNYQKHTARLIPFIL